MKIWQLAPDTEAYGEHAGWWIVTSDDGEEEIAGPYRTDRQALAWILGRRTRHVLVAIALISALTWLWGRR